MKLQSASALTALLAAALPVATRADLSVQSDNALDLAELIAGPGVSIRSAALVNCNNVQVGRFTNGEFDIDMDEGAVISSSYAVEAVGPNNNYYPAGDSLGRPGSALLDKLLQPKKRYTKDACTLRIEFDCDTPANFEFTYVFGSDNYPSTGNNAEEDVMGAFLNGDDVSNNVATVDGKYVSVNTLFDGTDFKDNERDTYDVEMNGFTQPLKSTDKGLAKATNNELDLVVADGYTGNEVDYKKGAWLFVKANSLRCDRNSGTGGGARVTAELCARLVRQQCRCRQRRCITRRIRNRCHATGTRDTDRAYRQKVRRTIRSQC